MKASRFLIKLIRASVAIILLLGIIIPTITFARQKFIYGIKKITTEHFNIENVSISLDCIYNKDVSQNIASLVTNYTKNHTLFSFKTKELHDILHKEYSLISDVDCSIRVPKSVNVHIVGINPYCIINNTHIIGNKQQLFPVDYFANFKDLVFLPKITINPTLCGKSLNQNLCAFLHKIPQKTWQTFAISYKSSSEIELIPKNTKYPCIITVDENSFFDSIKLKKLGTIFSDMIRRGFLLPKALETHDPCVAFDLRFDRRIVVKCKNAFNKRGMGL